MGKLQQATSAEAGTLEINSSSAQTGTADNDCHSLRRNFNCRCIVISIVSMQLLVFSLLMFQYHGNHGKSGSFPLLQVPIVASFQIKKSPSFIHSHIQQLEQNISGESGFSGKVVIVSIDNLPESNCTEVAIGFPLEGSKNASTELQMLKATFVQFFLRERNLSLPSSTFGKASNFQIEKFPGGITVVPEPSSLSRRGVLFNFTIRNSLSHVASRFTEFKLQLAEGICLGPDENLIMRLTNLDGSTSRPPVTVQTSVFKAVGRHLPDQRLKQLAQHVTRHLSKNLGLNHTMFGRVREVELSSFLKHLLEPHKIAPASAPSPSYLRSPHPRRSHHHHRSSSHAGTVAPNSHYVPAQGSPLLSPHVGAPAFGPSSESPQISSAFAPHAAYAPLAQTASPSASLPPASASSFGSPKLPSPVSVQASQEQNASPVQAPVSSCYVSKQFWTTLMLIMPIAALLLL